jgi:hypothetical protein
MALRSRLLAFLIAASFGLPGAAALGQSAATSPAIGNAVSVPAPDDPPLADDPLPNDGTIPPVPAPLPTTLAAAPQAAAPLAAALPAGSGVLDSATVQRIVDRLVQLHFLASAADAQDPDALTEAIREFQVNAGISPSGTLDRDTIGRLTTP